MTLNESINVTVRMTQDRSFLQLVSWFSIRIYLTFTILKTPSDKDFFL